MSSYKRNLILVLLLMLMLTACKPNTEKQLQAMGYSLDDDGYIKSLDDGNYEAIKLYLELGYDANLPIDEFSFPLSSVVQHNNLDIIKILLEHGADINNSDYYGDSILTMSIELDNADIVTYLIDNGADVNSNGGLPLSTAVKSNNINITKLLLDYGTKTENENYLLPPPILIAAAMNNIEIIELLLSYEANIDFFNDGDYLDYAYTEDTDYLGTALQIAVSKNYTELVSYLLNNGANPNVGNKRFPICTAAELGDFDLVEKLLNHGANINNEQNIEFNNGFTPLMLATKNNHVKVVYYLLDNDAMTEKSKEYMIRAFEIAVDNENIDLANVIYEYIKKID